MAALESIRRLLRPALFNGNGLARRVLLAVVLFSSAITAVITAIDLYAGYRRDVQAIEGAFRFVGASYLPSLANSVWDYDDRQIKSQLEALVTLPDVEYIAIAVDGQTRWRIGRAQSARTVQMSVPLQRDASGAVRTIGTLQIVASVDRVLDRVWARLAEVLLGNAIKTLLVAAFLLMSFQFLVTQHLARLAAFVRGIDPLDTAADARVLKLDRPAKGLWRPDILDVLSEAINTMLRSLRQARDELTASKAEVAESELRFRLGMDAAGAGVWDWDVMRHLVFLGPDGRRMLGLADAPGDDAAATRPYALAEIEALTHPQDWRQTRGEVVAHLAGRSERFMVELRFRHGDGWRWLGWHGRVVQRNAEGQAVRALGTLVDIHQRRLAEDAVIDMNRQLEQRVGERTLALEQARDDAVRASQAKSEFLSRMSHELRTPMNAILGFAQILSLSEPSPKQQRWAGQIQHAGEHLLRLIDELLDLSRIEVGKLVVQREAVAVAPVVRDAMGIVQAAQRSTPPPMDWQEAGPLPEVLADRLRLTQILVNLLSNAVKYNRDQGVITIRAALTDDGCLRLAVTDTGLGIPQHRLVKLFQPFERLGREDTAIEGTGVGLSLSKRLAELMGGHLGIDTVEGRGSTFWVDLPLAPATRAGQPTGRTPQGAGASTNVRRLRVLYIEDNAINREVMQAFFGERPSWHLLIAVDGEQGLAMAQAERPDVILLDLHLPGIDGYEVLRQLQRLPGTVAIPVIAVTADARPGDIARGQAAGFAHYLTKPVVLQALVAAIDQLAPAPTPAASP